MDAITAAHHGDIQRIDRTSVRAHQQAATALRGGGCRSLFRSITRWAHDQDPKLAKRTNTATSTRVIPFIPGSSSWPSSSTSAR